MASIPSFKTTPIFRAKINIKLENTTIMRVNSEDRSGPTLKLLHKFQFKPFFYYLRVVPAKEQLHL